MPNLDNNFFNPFGRWPFSTSPGGSMAGGVPLPNQSSSPPLCVCNGFDGTECTECSKNYMRNYAAAREYPEGSMQTPVKFGAAASTEQHEPRGIAQLSAADSLKAFTQKQAGKQREDRAANSVAYTSSGFFNKNIGLEPLDSTPVMSHKSITGGTRLTAGIQDLNYGSTSSTMPGDHWTRQKMGGGSSSTTQNMRESASNLVSPISKGTSDSSPTTWRSYNSMPSTGTAATTLSPGDADKSAHGISKNIWNTAPASSYSPIRTEVSGTRGKLTSPTGVRHLSPILSEAAPSKSEGSVRAKSVKSDPTGLGCTKCVFEPKLKVQPCGHLICLTCGGKYWGLVSSGTDVYCGCGDRVLSMVNLTSRDPPGLPKPKFQGVVYPMEYASPATVTNVQFAAPQATYSAQTIVPWGSEKSPGNAQPVSVTVPVAVSSGPAVQAAPQNAAVSSITTPFPGPGFNPWNGMMMMDAETAIQNAPFVELGRHSLAQNWSVVKIGNIPYNITTEEILEFLGKNSNIAPEPAGSVGVHVIMDRSTGKTMDAYVEFISSKDAWRCASRRRSRVLGNRHLTLEVVDQAELMKDIFPRAKGIIWDGVVPRAAPDGEFGQRKPEIIGREELVLIVNHARTPHRSPFSRKCLQRPFQSLMSTVSKFPWFAIDLYTLQQRDYIFQAVLSVVDILKRQIKRGRTMPNLDLDLLKSLVRVGVSCAGFTDAQKYEIAKTAEFGADGTRIDSELGIFAGLEGLAKAPGIESRVFEMYSLLIQMSLSPLISEPSLHGNAAIELFTFKGINKQPNDENEKGRLTMAEAAGLEWLIIEKCIRSVLPGKLPYVKNLTRTGTGVWRDKHQQHQDL